MASCSAAGPLLGPLVSGCWIPHPQGKPTGHCGRGCKVQAGEEKLVFSQAALVLTFQYCGIAWDSAVGLVFWDELVSISVASDPEVRDTEVQSLL